MRLDYIWNTVGSMSKTLYVKLKKSQCQRHLIKIFHSALSAEKHITTTYALQLKERHWCQNAYIFALWRLSEVKKRQSFAKHTCWKPALSHLTFLKRTKWIKLAQVCERLSSVRSDASLRLVHVNYSITPHRVGWGGKKESIRLLCLEEGTSGSVYRDQHTPASRYACTLICCLLNQHILPAWAVLQNGRKARIKIQILGSLVFYFNHQLVAVQLPFSMCNNTGC